MTKLQLTGCADPNAYIEVALRGSPGDGSANAKEQGKRPSQVADIGSFMLEKQKLREELEREERLTKVVKQECGEEEARLVERITQIRQEIEGVDEEIALLERQKEQQKANVRQEEQRLLESKEGL